MIINDICELNQEELLDNLIEVELVDEEAFLKITETLTRIGISNYKNDTLTQTCSLLQKRGKYYIVHFLELFMLDGKKTTMIEDDKKRAIAIAHLLQKWNLLRIVSDIPEKYQNLKPYMLGLTIISYNDKDNYELISKYTIGNK